MQIEYFNVKDLTEERIASFNEFFEKLESTTPNSQYLKVFHPKNFSAQLQNLEPIASKIKNKFKNVLLIGMGGAINNPLSILAFNKNPNINFYSLSTTDSFAVNELIAKLSLENTACLILSNTGCTIETIALSKYLAERFENENLNTHEHFYFILGKAKSPLMNIANKINALVIPHEENIGGRFSFFGPTGLLPALIADINIQKFLNGANLIINDIWSKRGNSSPALSALYMSVNTDINVTMSYLQSLSPLLDLYIQLIAESLGKDGKGISPIKAIGPLDQHSLLQLFLEGPYNKFYTFINIESNLNRCSDKLSHVHNAMFNATLDSLINTGQAIRVIKLREVDEFNLGKLFMHFYAEVILLGILLKVNPFDQPGVEQIKVRASKLLAEG